MSSDVAPSSRVLHSLLLPLVLLGAVVAASLAALVVEDDATDTVLGMVAGAGSVLLVFVVLVQVLGRRQHRRAADERALDGLEPLRAARRESPRPVGPDADPDAEAVRGPHPQDGRRP